MVVIWINDFSVPALFTFVLGAEGVLEAQESFQVAGNVLNVAIQPPCAGSNIHYVFVSIDTVHAPGSTSTLKDTDDQTIKPLLKLAIDNGRMSYSQEKSFYALDMEESGESIEPKYVSSLLYTLGNLRKREDEDRE